ncbi:MAG: hypothetical protein ACI8XM_000051 [Haloarculaceae archaeon]|jgi:hypothetical protein
MNNNNDFGKRVSEAQAEFEDRDVWTDKLEGIPVAQEVENLGEMMTNAAVDEEGIAELRPTREQEKAGKRDYDWSRNPNLDHPEGRTLAQEERMLGEEAEMERQRERAVAAEERGLERARSCREQSEWEAREQTRAYRGRMKADPAREGRPEPRSELDQETVAECNQDAQRLQDARVGAPSRAALSRMLAEHRADGADACGALMAVQDDLDELSGVPRRFDEYEPWMAKDEYELRVTAQATVVELYEPAKANQQQVAVLENESGRAKLTVWRSSQVDTIMREGDTVRVTDGIAGWYKGQAQIAADGETRIGLLERGNGPATHRLDGGVFGAEYRGDDDEDPPAPSDPEMYDGPRHPTPGREDE